MRIPHTIGVGWLLTLVATLLLCISGLYWANVRTMNAAIDHVIQETFEEVMVDVAQALKNNPQTVNNMQCDTTSQQMLERTHAQLEPVLRVSVARGGRIWCDSETTTIGTTVPETWPQASAVGEKPKVFKTTQLTGAVLALSPAPDEVSLWIFVTPFKDYDKGLDAIWGLGWPYLITTSCLLAVICMCAMWLLRLMESIFEPEYKALQRLKATPATAPAAETATHDLIDLAAKELLKIEREQEEITSRMERT
jgi:hypothetical protein